MPTTTLNYETTGVNYDQLDAFKRACQKAARATAAHLAPHGYTEPPDTRGESAYLIEAPDHYLAHVEEGLGTKNLVADAMSSLPLAPGKQNHPYHAIAIDTIATIVNDLITTGALPISIAMHAAVGDSAWFTDTARMNALIEGWSEGCRQSGATWGGGETPTLRGIVTPGAIALAGSAIGKITPKKHRITADIHDGDAIILLASTGVHTNGLTLCREIAARLPQGYRTPIGHGDPRTLGEALLAPSAIYVAFVRECQRRDIKLNYLVHLTGHGWRKLMRPEEPCLYEITTPRPPPPLFRFLQEAGPITQREMYATFNQGAGFAAYVAPDKIESTLAAAKATGYDAWHAGRIRKAGARKAVRIPPLDLEYTADTLALR